MGWVEKHCWNCDTALKMDDNSVAGVTHCSACGALVGLPVSPWGPGNRPDDEDKRFVSSDPDEQAFAAEREKMRTAPVSSEHGKYSKDAVLARRVREAREKLEARMMEEEERQRARDEDV